MKLIGGYRSPYVRRVAVSINLMGIAYEHEPTSPFNDQDSVRQFNPLSRVPTLVLDNGETLVESYAILDTLNELAEEGRQLIPQCGPGRRRVMKLTAIATGTIDKLIWSIYEKRFRPEDKVHEPWIAHNEAQTLGGLDYLNDCAKTAGDDWLAGGDRISQADVSGSIAFAQTELARPKLEVAERFPYLAVLATRCATMGAFASVAPS